MTKFAKIMIFLTVAMSIVMAAWALGVYTNHIDWSANKATADRPAGELTKRIDRINLLRAVLSGTSADDKGKGNALMRGPGGAHKALEEKKEQKLAELIPSLRVLSEELKKLPSQQRSPPNTNNLLLPGL